jgi:hypothetical protein
VIADHPAQARAVLDAAIRVQLREAWERGIATAPNGPNSRADAGAGAGFDAVAKAADDYAASLALFHGSRP